MWTILLIIAISVLWIWIGATENKVPNPRQIEMDEVLPCMQDALVEVEGFLLKTGFRVAGIFDCEIQSGQKAQVSVFINDARNVDFAIIGVQQEAMIAVIWEFTTALSPHGVLSTNTNKHPDVYHHAEDNFVLKMPWIKNVETLHNSHLEHLRVLESENFNEKKLSYENTPYRISNETRHLFEIQVVKKRMKKTKNGTYVLTFWGALLSVPKIANTLLASIAKLLVGRRSSNWRLRSLRESARIAKRMPENMKLYHDRI